MNLILIIDVFFKINKRKEKQNNIETHVKTEEKNQPG